MEDDQLIYYSIDLVLCIDASESMHDMLDKVKECAMRFYDELKAEYDKIRRRIRNVRVKVIAFRDMTIGEPNEVSEWFSLPSQSADFKAFLDKLEARGGGDGSETAIDALSLAMMQDWVKNDDRRRHLIVLWTDASTKPPGEQKMDPRLPQSMPEFIRMWQDPRESTMDYLAKRLAIWAPNDDSWAFVESLDSSSYQEVYPTKEIDELSMELVIEFMAGAI
jgi:hypothetical protein